MSLIQVQVRSPRTIVYSYEIFPFSTFGFNLTSLTTSLCHNQNLVVFRATLVTVQLNLKGSHSLLWSGLGRTVSQVQLLLGQQPTANIIRDKVCTIFAMYLEFFSCFLYDGTLIICI